MPTERQILGAKIRAANDAYVKARRKPCAGGYEVPSNQDRYRYLAKKFGMAPHEISHYFTFTRYCEHPWSKGACNDCPDVGPRNT